MLHLDAPDRHILQVAAVLVAVVALGLPLAGIVLGLAVRCFMLVSGVGQ